MPKSPIIAVDFDGTCVDHQYPAVGGDVPGAAEWLRYFVECGARLMLWTMRSDGRADGTTPLADAVAWFAAHAIPLWAVNTNPEQDWSTSSKQYAHAYIDDAAIGCPLRPSLRLAGQPMVDWAAVGPVVVGLFGLEPIVAPVTPEVPPPCVS